MSHPLVWLNRAMWSVTFLPRAKTVTHTHTRIFFPYLLNFPTVKGDKTTASHPRIRSCKFTKYQHEHEIQCYKRTYNQERSKRCKFPDLFNSRPSRSQAQFILIRAPPLNILFSQKWLSTLVRWCLTLVRWLLSPFPMQAGIIPSLTRYPCWSAAMLHRTRLTF